MSTAEEPAQRAEKSVETTVRLADRLWRGVKVCATGKGLSGSAVGAAFGKYIEESEKEG